MQLFHKNESPAHEIISILLVALTSKSIKYIILYRWDKNKNVKGLSGSVVIFLKVNTFITQIETVLEIKIG